MLKSLDALDEGFRGIVKKSKEECGDELEEIRQLVFIIGIFYMSLVKSLSLSKEYRVRIESSLALMCFTELSRISGHILFLSCNGLYRNAFDNVRYALESIVQALYIDHRHPETPLKTKIEILKEVEDKREYHVVRLIDELKIDHKDMLKRQYKELSQVIHPSHKQIVTTLSDLMEDKGVPATVDCKEISKIYNSMIKMYDIFFFLFITHFPEVKITLKKNSNFIKLIKDYNLILLSKIFKVQLDK
jgi:hypothetical protein